MDGVLVLRSYTPLLCETQINLYPNLHVTFSLFHSCQPTIAILLIALCYLCLSTLCLFFCNSLERIGYYTDHLQQQIIYIFFW
jgi:hypothetical protein